MNTVIMWIMAFGAVIGGVDCIIGNRFGLGERFEAGFHMLGPIALPQVGILCLAPVISNLIGPAITPFFNAIGVDPAMFGCILANDMGGYQLANALAEDPRLGTYFGVLVSAMFGCTIVFTIPVGMSALRDEDKPLFARGILYGLISMPVALLVGGLLCGLSLFEILRHNMLVLALAAILLICIRFAPVGTLKAFTVFSSGIRILSTAGLIVAAFTYMTGVELIPYAGPIEDAMAVISSVGVVLLGSLPVAEMLKRALHKPLEWIGRRTGMNATSIAGFLICTVSLLPVIMMYPEMDKRGRIVNAAFFVCALSMMAGHLGFTASFAPDMLGALVITKLSGGVAGILVSLLATRKMANAADAGAQ